jgi:methyl-accepting chemotaxis protein
MLLLVGIAVSGYGAFGVAYYRTESVHQALLHDNSTYIQFEQYVRSAEASRLMASLALTASSALSTDQVRSTAVGFVEAARTAANANRVTALEPRLRSLVAGAEHVEAALRRSPIDIEQVRRGLSESADSLAFLVAISSEGRKAEWDNLLSGNQSNFESLIALIIIGTVTVGALGYLVESHVKRVFADVIRINLAIAARQFDIDIPTVSARTEVGQMYTALRGFRENAQERARLEAAAKSQQVAAAARQRRIEEQIGDFREHVQELLASAAQEMEQMRTAAKSLVQFAAETSDRASGAAQASGEVSLKAQAVAVAAESLASSIDEINRQVRETTNAVADAAENARATNRSVSDLADASQTIGEIAVLIRDVASQTNLLALNATIEAARAGDLGKGFAVVATEIKSLADQTAKATEDITVQISSIQKSSSVSADVIKKLAFKVETVNSYANSIAMAVERQYVATASISNNVQQAALETQKAAVNMSGVTSATTETARSAALVEQASDNAINQTVRLRGVINQFLDSVASQ